MSILCLWELVERDSAAEVVLALVVFISMSGALALAAAKVIRLARRSVSMHKNPAYILYSDPTSLNKWGFLYVQYRATAYYFVLPFLAYILLKALFIAFCQSVNVVQAIGLLIIEAGALIGVCILRPWMDKKTNVFNISIAAFNFLNVIFLLIFSGVFGQPGLVTGISGVLFVLFNVVFAVVLLILVLIASVYAIASKNPETRYQPMRDDRGSFIKSQSALTTELDALGAIARGDGKEGYNKERGLVEDDESLSSNSFNHQQRDAAGVPLGPPAANPPYRPSHLSLHDNQGSYTTDQPAKRGPPNSYDQHSAIIDAYHDESGSDYYSGHGSQNPASRPYQNNGYGGGYGNGYQQVQPSYSYPHQPQYRQQNNPSPWQRGAGYD